MFGCLGKMALGLAVGGFVTLGGCALVMSSCTVGLGGIASQVAEGVDPDDVVSLFDQGVERLGTLALASPSRLAGTLSRSADGYGGSYEEACRDLTQSCALFGGTDLDCRTIAVRFSLEEGTGSARLVLKQFGGDVVIARAGETGERSFDLDPGSHYVCLETTDYSGAVQVEVSEA